MKNIKEAMNSFLEISLSLTDIHDREKLLSRILDRAIEFAECDAGTLYLIDDDGLEFCRMVTLSMGVRQGGHASPITLPPVPMDEKFVSSWVAIHNEPINLPDVQKSKRFDFSGSQRYDEMTGYDTRSMLVVPLANEKGVVIGVMQLINALNDKGKVIPFDHDLGLFIEAIAAQAAISITNMQYARELSDFVTSLAGGLATAIDGRSDYDKYHTRNTVRYARNFLRWLEETGNRWRFNEDRYKSFLLSVWLHDIGNLAVPVEFIDKTSKLGTNNVYRIHSRFKQIHFLNKIDMLEGRITQEEYEAKEAQFADVLAFVDRMNNADRLTDEEFERLEAIEQLTYTNEKGEEKPWVKKREIDSLCIEGDVLSDSERKIKQGHVTAADNILSGVMFPRWYRRTPEWVAMHHEQPNGKGYPDRLEGDEIPKESRLIAVLDTFEDLVNDTRPNRTRLTPEEAIEKMSIMADKGILDKSVVRMFEQSRAWEGKKQR